MGFHLAIGLTLSAATGLSLGLIGGGGSIIIVPVLVYIVGVEPHEAVGMSLAVVGVSNLNQKEFEQELDGPVEDEPAIVFDNKVYSYRGLFSQRRYKSLTGTFGIDGYRRNYRTQGEEI